MLTVFGNVVAGYFFSRFILIRDLDNPSFSLGPKTTHCNDSHAWRKLLLEEACDAKLAWVGEVTCILASYQHVTQISRRDCER